MKPALVLCLLAALGLAQTPQTPPPEEPLVRLNVDLVQVDAIVTDAQGNHVTDLKPEEFEILENGKPQRITNFSYIQEGRPAAVPASMGKQIAATPVAPARVAPGEAGRTIAIVIDDLGIGEQSFAAIHKA